MKPKLHRTYTPKKAELQRDWYVVDATDVPVGRLASEVAQVLRGKHKPTYAPHMDGGDFVVVVNAEKVAATGGKETDKRYYRHSGYPGGISERALGDVRKVHPERVVEQAIRGMLPKNRLGRDLFRKLKVYAGPDHPHAAQAPKPLAVKSRKVEA